MSYQALYRAYRSTCFAEVVGQDHVIRTLKNQVIQGRISHAYLFCGSRGTGKTSTAKILARAINCADPQDGEPCGRCASCQALAQDRSMDVVEIDAASNNGVDEIRDLREKVAFQPTVGRYKVYIIDEVHMLSPGAFNAFLKTLEEPPPHAVFILATTEPQKLPATILSRCQRFDFHRIRVEDIVFRLRQVLGGVEAEEEALTLIARAAEGGMRDALSLLDRAMAYGSERITAQDVLGLLGTASDDFFFEMAAALLEDRPGDAMTALNRLMEEGKDPAVFARDMTRHFRALMLTRACGACADLLDVSEEKAQSYARQAEAYDPARIRRALARLAALEGELRFAAQPRIQVELALMDICRTDAEPDAEALRLRLEKLEEQVRQGAVAKPAAAKPAAPRKRQEGAAVAEAASAPPAPPASAVKAWDEIRNAVRGSNVRLFYSLKRGECQGLEGDVLTVAFPEEHAIHLESMEKNLAVINQAAAAVFGRPVTVKGVVQTAAAVPSAAQAALELFGSDRVVIEEQ